jgi:hypothetical protein
VPWRGRPEEYLSITPNSKKWAALALAMAAIGRDMASRVSLIRVM